MTLALRTTPRIFALTNQKGGVGKTTTAINLGTGLAISGHRTLLIDLDPQGNASTGLGSFSDERPVSTYHALTGASDFPSVITETDVANLHLAPASVDLSGVDVELVNEADRAHRLSKLIASLKDQPRYDYILIDCPPSLNLLTINAMVAANAVIVPLQCEFFALEGLTQLLETIKRVQNSLNRSLRVEGIILTMYDQRNKLSMQVANDVRTTLGDIVFKTIIPRNVRLSEAPSHAMPALVYDARCSGSVAYQALARELLNRDGRTLAA